MPPLSGKATPFRHSAVVDQLWRPVPRLRPTVARRWHRRFTRCPSLWWADSWADAKAQWEEKQCP